MSNKYFPPEVYRYNKTRIITVAYSSIGKFRLPVFNNAVQEPTSNYEAISRTTNQ